MHKDMGLVFTGVCREELAKLKRNHARLGMRVTRLLARARSKRRNLSWSTVCGVRCQLHTTGNLINADVLRDELERRGSIFQTTADSEIILHLLAQQSDNGGNVLAALRRIQGAFSLIIMSERELFACAGSFWVASGLRSAKTRRLLYLASETCASI